MVYINTLMIQKVLAQPHWQDRMTPRDYAALTPLIWEHINPYGRFHLDMIEMAAGDTTARSTPSSIALAWSFSRMIMSFIMQGSHARGSGIMSTKSTLKHDRDQSTGQSFHLYEECFEDGQVYLELEGFPFEAASSAIPSEQGLSRIVVRLPNAWARKLGLLEKNDDAA